MNINLLLFDFNYVDFFIDRVFFFYITKTIFDDCLKLGKVIFFAVIDTINRCFQDLLSSP